MKLAISNIAWEPAENAEIVAILEEIGIRGVELAPTLLFDRPAEAGDAAIAEERRYWNDRGIAIVALQALLFGRPELQLFGTSQERAAMADYLKKIIELGGKLGAGVLVFGSPKNRIRGELGWEAALEIAAGFFGDLAATAVDCGTCLCIEPNAREYGCDFVLNLEQALDLVNRVGHPGFGLHVDAGVLTLNGETDIARLQGAAPHMRHFHISEPFLGRITDGCTDHVAMGKRLKAVDYPGWRSIEMRSGLGNSNLDSVRQSLHLAISHYD